MAVSAALGSGILTVNIDSTDSVKSAFVRSDGTNYIVSTTTGGAGISISGGPATVASTTGITVNGVTFGAESLTFEGANDFTLTGALTTTKLETVTFNRQVSFGSVVLGTDTATTVNINNQMTATAGSITIQSTFLNVAADLNSTTADINLQLGTGGLALANNLTAADDVRLDTTGAITQTAGIITAANLGVRSQSDVSLTRNNLVSTNFAAAAHDVTFNNVSTGLLTIGTVGSIPNFFSTNGLGDSGVTTITTSGALSVTSTSNSDGGLNLKSTGLLTLNAIMGASAGAMRFVSSGGINQVGSIIGGVDFSAVNTGSGDILLMGSNNFTGNFAANNAVAGGFVKYRNAFGSSITVGTVAAGPGAFGAVTGITTSSGDVTLQGKILTINQAINAGTGVIRLRTDGGVSQGASGTIVGSALGVRNGTSGAIDLSGTGNNVATVAMSNSFTGGTAKYRDTNAVNIGSVSAESIAFVFNALDGVVATDGTFTLVAGGVLAVNQTILGGTGTVRLGAVGGVSQTASGVITAFSLGVANATSGSIDLTTATTNNVANFAASNAASLGSIKYRDTDALSISSVSADGTLFNAVNNLSSANGDITLVSGALTLNQGIAAGTGTVRLNSAGNISQGATAGITAAALGVRSTGSFVTLSSATNNDVGTLAIADGTTAATARFVDVNDLVIGSVTADGTLFTAASGVSLTNGDLTLVTGGALSLQSTVNIGSTGDTFLISAGGNVTQTASGTVTAGGIGARTTAGDIDLTTVSNNILQFAASNSGAGKSVKVRTAGAGLISSMPADGTLFTATTGIATNGGNVTIVTGSGLTINQAIAAGTGTVRLSAAGSITQAVVGSITGSLLGLRTTFGNIDLTTSTTNNVATYSAVDSAAGGYIKYRDADGFAVGSVTADGTLFTATNGISTANGGTSTNGAAATTGNDVTLVGGALAVNQAINVGTATVRMNAAGGISQTSAGVITASSFGVRNATSGDINLTGSTGNYIGTFAAFNGAVGAALTYTPADVTTVGTVLADGSLFAQTVGATRTNAAPVLSVNAGPTLAEGATAVLDGTRLKTNDVDNTTAQLVYTVTILPTHGTVNLSGAVLPTNGTFTQADLDAGKVTYTHDSSENFSDNFQFTVTDGQYSLSTATFALTITPVNDAPVLATNAGLMLDEGAAATIGNALLRSTDIDSTAAQLVYTVVTAPTHGTLFNNGVALAASGTFSQADVDSSKLTYTHDGSEATSDGVTAYFDNFDGGGISLGGTIATFSGVTNTEGVQGYAGLGTGANVFSGSFLRNTSGGAQEAPGSVTPTKTTLTLSGLPSHSSIDLNFLLAIINSWDGNHVRGGGNLSGFDIFNVTVDGVVVLSDYFANFTSSEQTYVPPTGVQLTSRPFSDLGFPQPQSFPDAAYNMGLDPRFDNIAHASSTVTIEWFASGPGWQGGSDESWAIDNVEVKLNGVASATTNDSFAFTVSDGSDGAIGSTNFAITVNAVNDAPKATITPVSYAATEQVALTLKNTGLSISDADGVSGLMTVTLSVTEGTLTVTAGGSGAVVTNSGTSNITITGTVTQINNLLSSDATSTVNYTDDTDTPSASATLTLHVSDNGNSGTGGTLTANDTAAINLTAVNDAPTATAPAIFTVTEDVAGNLLCTGTPFVDVDSTSVTVTLSVADGTITGNSGTGITVGGTATARTFTGTIADLNTYFTTTGKLVYTTVLDNTASRTLTTTVSDGSLTNVTPVTSTINVTPVNDAPTAAVNLGLTLAEGGTGVVGGNLLRTDDVDNSPGQRTYTLTAVTAHGALAANGVALATGGTFTQADLDAGLVSYTHDSSENFADNFQFTVADGEFTLTSAAFALTITPVNDSPTAGANQGLTLAEGATATIGGGLLQTNDVDNTSAQLVYTVTNLPAHGTVNLGGAALLVNGTFTQADLDAGGVSYTHDSSEHFSDELKFTVSDGEYALSEATFALTIAPVNDSPTATLNLGATLAEGATVTIGGGLLQTNDVDNTSAQLVYTVTNLPAHGTVNLGGVALLVNGTFTQADLDAGLVSYTHDSSENFSDNFQFTVGDGEFTLTSAAFALTITPVNDAPLVAPQNFILYNRAVAGTIVGTVQASDRDAGQRRSFALVGGNGALAIHAATGVLSVVNPNLLVGTALNFVVRVTDDGVPPLTTDAAIAVSLRAADAPPTFAVVDGASAPLAVVNNQVKLALDERTDVTATRNGLVIAGLAAADVDEPGVFFPLTMTDRSGAFAFNAVTGKLSILDAAKLDYEKTRSFSLTFTATDHGLIGLPRPVTATLTMTVQLTDRNDAPTAAPAATFKLRENNGANTVVGTVTAADVDGLAAFKNLQYGIVSQRDAAGGDVGIFSIDAARGTLKIVAAGALNYEAQPQYTVVVRARDAAGLFVDQTVTVQVIDVNEAVVLALLDAAQNPTTGLTVPENTAKGTVVGYLRVDNPDVARAETIKITLNDSVGKGFAVGAFDAATHLAPITVFDAARLNYEALNKGQFTLNFSVSDSGFLSNDGSRPGGITVNKTYNSLVADVNEAPTAIIWRTVGLPGGTAPIPAGTLFGTALGVDPDKTPQAFTYSLPPGALNNDLFTIDPLTGQLRSGLPLARKGTFNLLLRVTDAGGLFFNLGVVIKT